MSKRFKLFRTIIISNLSLDDGCVYCGKPATDWDHIIPRSSNGRDTIDNLVPSCRSCNLKKRDHSLAVFLNRIGKTTSEIPKIYSVEVKVYRNGKDRKYVTDDKNIVIHSKRDIKQHMCISGKKKHGAPICESSLVGL
jgi:hypothetical protein